MPSALQKGQSPASSKTTKAKKESSKKEKLEPKSTSQNTPKSSGKKEKKASKKEKKSASKPTPTPTSTTSIFAAPSGPSLVEQLSSAAGAPAEVANVTEGNSKNDSEVDVDMEDVAEISPAPVDAGNIFSVTSVDTSSVTKKWVPVVISDETAAAIAKKTMKKERREKGQNGHADDSIYTVKLKNAAEVESDHDSDDDEEIEYKSHVNDGISDLSDLSDDSDAEVDSEQDDEKDDISEEKKESEKNESKKKKKAKVVPLTKIQERNAQRERGNRTIFVGNVPIKVNQKAFKNMFKEFGPIESVRFRSVAVANPRMSHKVAFLTKQTHADRTSMNAYVVYKTEEGVQTCITNAKGLKLDGHHLRVDVVGDGTKKFTNDTKSTVFVGGLPLNVEDEMLYTHFGQCGTVESVRIIRDKATGIGKGIAYVKFEAEAAVGLAVRLDGSEVGSRKIRVSKAMSTDRQKKVKEAKEKTDFQGVKVNPLKRKSSAVVESSANASDLEGKKKKMRWSKDKFAERDAKEGTVSRAMNRQERTVLDKREKPKNVPKAERPEKMSAKDKAHGKKVKEAAEKKTKKPKWTDEKRKEKGAQTKSEKHRSKKIGKDGAERRMKKAKKSA
eukprot:CFRG2843T1